jgi:hypothetical protein
MRGRWAAVVGLGSLAVGALCWQPLSDLRGEQRAAAAFADVSRCMWGADPAHVDRPDARLRAVAIAAAVDEANASWPSRCEPYVSRLRSALDVVAAHRRAVCEQAQCEPALGALEPLRDEAGRLSTLVDRGEAPSFDAERFFALARAEGLVERASRDVPRPPAPARLLDAAAMRPLFRGDYLRLLTDPAGDESLDLVFYEHETRYGMCTVSLLDRGQARCRTLPSAIPVGFAGELFAAERGAPTRMYAQGPDGDRWTQALYDVSTGQKLTTVSQRPLGGFVWRDGTMASLGFEPPLRDVSLTRLGGDDDGMPVPVSAPSNAVLGPRLIWDEVFWAETGKAGRLELFARHAQSDGEPLGPARAIGETLPLGAKPSLDICRTDRSLIALVSGRRHRDGALGTLIFRTERGWQEPIHLRLGAGRFGFTCQNAGATISWIKALEEHEVDAFDGDDGDDPAVRGRYGIYRLRCTAEGCDRGRAVVNLTRHHRASRYVAGNLGDSMVVMWRSPLGDVRMRVAPLDELPGAPEVPLFDDVEHDGFGWDLERDPIFGRAGHMLVLVSRQIGTSDETATYGLRVDASGGVSPVGIVDVGGERAMAL